MPSDDESIARPTLETSFEEVEALRRRVAELEAETREHRRLAEELRRLSFAVEQCSEGIAIWDLEGRLQFVNYAFSAMHGRPPEAMVGQPLSICHTPEQMRAVEAAHQRLRKVGRFNGKVWHARSDGSVFPGLMHNTLFRDADGETLGMIGTLRDLSEQLRAEEELYESRELFRTLTEQSVAGILIVQGGRVLYTNHAVSGIIGYSIEEVRSWPTDGYLRILHPEDRGFVREQARRRATGQSQGLADRFSCRLLPRAGGERGVDLYAKTIRYNGRYATLATVVDVTEKRQAEREKERLRDQLVQTQKMEAVGRLTAGIAHDFNNLLTVINGFVELARMGLEDDHPVQDSLDKSLESGARAADLVRKLLAFSRKQVVEPRIMSLNLVVGDMEKMLRRVIGEHIRLETDLVAEPWPVKVDPVQTEQVIANLAVNARDAMPEGGDLRIETANLRLEEALLADSGTVEPGDYVTLTVSDTGVGIPAEHLPRIFEPFFTTKRGDKGTGLGLFTVYGIVNQAGGHIAVRSSEGSGTVFRIYLPRSDEKPQPPAHPQRLAGAPSGRGTILLVEDDDAVRELARRVLELQGYRVLQAENGQQALALVADCEEPIELLLTDVVMPGLSGKALAEKLAEGRPELKILFMSGYNEEMVSRHGVEQANVALLQKPFTSNRLVGTVRALLESPQSA